MLPHGDASQSEISGSSAWVVVAGKYPGVGPVNTRGPDDGENQFAGPLIVAVTTTPLGVVPVATLPDTVQVAGYCEPAGTARAGLAETTAPSATALRVEPASAEAITAARTLRPLFTPTGRLRWRMAGKG